MASHNISDIGGGSDLYSTTKVVVDDERFFHNKADDYKISKEKYEYLNACGNEFSAKFSSIALGQRNDLLNKLMKKMAEKETDIMNSDITVYTGLTGIAMLYLKIASGEASLDISLETKALQYLTAACQNQYYKSKMEKRPTFLCGIAGPLAIKAVVHSDPKHFPQLLSETDAQECVNNLLKILPATLTPSHDLPNEMLYGRAGYLYALLYAKNKIAIPVVANGIKNEDISKLVNTIIDHGSQYAKKTKRPVPMWWEWHEKEYLGGAHGVAGILYILLCAKNYFSDDLMNSHVKPTLDYFVKFQFPSGNFPSSVSAGARIPTNDKLLHWCHGAPGVVHLLLNAHSIWPSNEDSYLVRARRCGDAIWKRGLLKKGYGICHGVAGNTYAFINLWRATSEPEFLYKAAVFAEWCFVDDKLRNCRTPDRPLSLFEGTAGLIYLLTDLIQSPSLASFPAFCDAS